MPETRVPKGLRLSLVPETRVPKGLDFAKSCARGQGPQRFGICYVLKQKPRFQEVWDLAKLNTQTLRLGGRRLGGTGIMEVDHDEHTSVISETFGQEWQEDEGEGLDTSIDQDYINGLVFFSVKVCKLCAHGLQLSARKLKARLCVLLSALESWHAQAIRCLSNSRLV